MAEEKSTASSRRYGAKGAGESAKPESKPAETKADKQPGGPGGEVRNEGDPKAEMHARHKHARHEMAKRHEKEHRDLHGQHRDAMRDMHARQEQEMQAQNSAQDAELAGAGAGPQPEPDMGGIPPAGGAPEPAPGQ